MTGAHPNEVKAVMRHSSITLTMDTYGHLFPGQEADAVARVEMLMSRHAGTMHATGTDDAGPVGAQRQAQRALRETSRTDAMQCDDDTDKQTVSSEQKKTPKPLRIAGLGDVMRASANTGEKRRARDSNPQPREGQLISNQPPSHSDTLRHTSYDRQGGWQDGSDAADAADVRPVPKSENLLVIRWFDWSTPHGLTQTHVGRAARRGCSAFAGYTPSAR